MNKKTENTKKILIAFIVFGLFIASSYYYTMGKKQTRLPQMHHKAVQNEVKPSVNADIKPISESNKTVSKSSEKTSSATEAKNKQSNIKSIPAKKEKVKQEKTPEKITNNKIKSTDIKTLMANATKKSGKNDPFSYAESRAMPFKSGGQASSRANSSVPGALPDLNMLPVPPELSTEQTKESVDPVIVKGFIGNKVIAEIKGYTESLGINESLKGVKVLSVDSANLTTVFLVDGKKIIKTIQPVTPKENKNVEINYIH